MRLGDVRSSLLAVASAAAASLCCLLPLVVVVVGLGSGAFMAVTMRYAGVLIPVGVLGTAAGYALYLRERRRCAREGCRMAAGRLNVALLLASTIVLVAAVTLTALPDLTARLIASWGGTPVMRMERAASQPDEARVRGPAVAVAAAQVVLAVDGMT